MVVVESVVCAELAVIENFLWFGNKVVLEFKPSLVPTKQMQKRKFNSQKSLGQG